VINLKNKEKGNVSDKGFKAGEKGCEPGGQEDTHLGKFVKLAYIPEITANFWVYDASGSVDIGIFLCYFYKRKLYTIYCIQFVN
jgi:hypothetical protein